jgi:hypothetical protein
VIQNCIKNSTSYLQSFLSSYFTKIDMTKQAFVLHIVSFIVSHANAYSLSVGWNSKRAILRANPTDFVDVPYERVPSETTETVSVEDVDGNTENPGKDIPLFRSKSILDETRRGNNVTFPFIEPSTQQVLTCRIAVTAKLEDDQLYAVGIPEDNGVLMIIERSEPSERESSAFEYLDPDDDTNLEVFELMAGALHKYLSTDLKLQRTPRILTIAGDLQPYLDSLPENLLSEDLSLESLLQEPDVSDAAIDKLFSFFEEQLGPEVYNQVMSGETTELDPNLQSLFDLVKYDSEHQDEDVSLDLDSLEEEFRTLGDDISHNGVGIKLVGFHLNNDDTSQESSSTRDRNSKKLSSTTEESAAFYSLVKPIQPLTVVGRLKKDHDSGETVFELLSSQEEALIVPRLERICQEDLEAQGITINSNTNR